jgi:hypothetical protein
MSHNVHYRLRTPKVHAQRMLAACIPIAVVALLLAASPAQAARTDCDTIYGEGTLCMWDNTNYTGTLFAWNPGLGYPLGEWDYIGNSANDKASSLWNHRNLWVSWISADWPNSATQACLATEEQHADLSQWLYPNNLRGANNNISSFEMSNSRESCPSGSQLVKFSAATGQTNPGAGGSGETTTSGPAAPPPTTP